MHFIFLNIVYFSFVVDKGKYDISKIVNGILSALVSITGETTILHNMLNSLVHFAHYQRYVYITVILSCWLSEEQI